jgi:hypothetical protein
MLAELVAGTMIGLELFRSQPTTHRKVDVVAVGVGDAHLGGAFGRAVLDRLLVPGESLVHLVEGIDLDAEMIDAGLLPVTRTVTIPLARATRQRSAGLCAV